MLGMSFVQMEELTLAMPYLLRSVELNPEDGEALFQYGIVLARSGFYEDAINMLERVLLVKPEDPDALYNIGAAYLAWQGDIVLAKNYFERAIATGASHELAENALNAIQDLENEAE